MTHGQFFSVVIAAFLILNPAKSFSEEPGLSRLEVVDAGDPSRLLDVTAWQGRAAVLYVWGEWCRACERSTPELLALTERFPEVRFVFINTDDPARRLNAVRHPNLVEAQVDRNFFGPKAMRKKDFRFSELGLVFGVPAYFVINQAGQVVERGNGSRYPASLPPILARLLSEKSL